LHIAGLPVLLALASTGIHVAGIFAAMSMPAVDKLTTCLLGKPTRLSIHIVQNRVA